MWILIVVAIIVAFVIFNLGKGKARVVRLASRGSVPAAYVGHGFMSPQSAEVMFSFAANMESRGASFTEQQMATAKFIEAWDEMSSEDKATFLRATAR